MISYFCTINMIMNTITNTIDLTCSQEAFTALHLSTGLLGPLVMVVMVVVVVPVFFW